MLCMNWPLLHSHILLDSLFCLSSLLVMLRFPLVMLSLEGGKLLERWLVWCRRAEALTWAVTTRFLPTLREGSPLHHAPSAVFPQIVNWASDGKMLCVAGPGFLALRFGEYIWGYFPCQAACSICMLLKELICFAIAHSLATGPTQLGHCQLNIFQTEALDSRSLTLLDSRSQCLQLLCSWWKENGTMASSSSAVQVPFSHIV